MVLSNKQNRHDHTSKNCNSGWLHSFHVYVAYSTAMRKPALNRKSETRKSFAISYMTQQRNKHWLQLPAHYQMIITYSMSWILGDYRKTTIMNENGGIFTKTTV